MEACMEELLNLSRKKLNIAPQDSVGFMFQDNENDKASFAVSFRRFDQYSPELLLSALDAVIQSNTNFLIDDKLIIKVDYVAIPVGGGRKSCVGKSSEEFFKIHKNSIFSPIIRSEDGNICLLTAVLIGKAHADGAVSQNLYNYLTYPPNHNDLIEMSKNLHLRSVLIM